MVWIALAAAIAVWISGGASTGATAVPSLRIFALPGGPTGAGAGVVVVVVLPGGREHAQSRCPRYCEAALAAKCLAHPTVLLCGPAGLAVGLALKEPAPPPS